MIVAPLSASVVWTTVVLRTTTTETSIMAFCIIVRRMMHHDAHEHHAACTLCNRVLRDACCMVGGAYALESCNYRPFPGGLAEHARGRTQETPGLRVYRFASFSHAKATCSCHGGLDWLYGRTQYPKVVCIKPKHPAPGCPRYSDEAYCFARTRNSPRLHVLSLVNRQTNEQV
jgi:hypothetical protein